MILKGRCFAMRGYNAHGSIEGNYQVEVIGGAYAESDGWIICNSTIHIAVAKIADALPIVLETQGKVFATAYVVSGKHGYTLKFNKRALIVLAAMRVSAYESGYEPSQTVMKLSPYVHAFFECQDQLKYELRTSSSKEDAEECLRQINAFAEGLYFKTTTKEFKRIMANHLRACQGLAKSFHGYIDYLSSRHARLLVLRLDLGYHKSPEEAQAELEGNYLKAFDPKIDEHRIAFFRELTKKGSPFSMVGYACKLEHAPRKGFHFHVMLFLDGSKVREHLSIGAVIGKLWSQTITGGDGYYWNCKDTAWIKADGTGRLDYYDIEQLARVKAAADYLTKQDFWVRVYIGENRRTFYRGEIRSGQPKTGRPRAKTLSSSKLQD
jgi:hypothetical protein